MFSRFVTLLSIAAVVAAAAPQAAPNVPKASTPNAPQGGDVGSASQCITSSQYCCNQKFSDPTQLSGDIGAVLNAITGVTVPAGLTCTPISILGLGNAGDCTDQPACCMIG